MPKVTAPLLSFGAQGQVAKTQVYSTWKGIKYVRQYVIPANPRTIPQVRNRSKWALLGQIFQYLPTQVQDAFNAYAKGKPLTGRNHFYSVNQKLLTDSPTRSDLDGFIFSAGANGGVPPTNLVITPGAGSLTAEVEVPAGPTGWEVISSVAVAIKNQNPTDPFAGVVAADSEEATPGVNVLNGLDAGDEYVVGVFLVWMKPNGSMAYSISLSGTGTPN